MKQQLHRSITFWSGILVMVFIGWAWRDSFHQRSSVSFDKWGISNCDGGLMTSRLSRSAGSPFATYREAEACPHPEWDAVQPPFFLRGALAKEEDFDFRLFDEGFKAARDARESGLVMASTWTTRDWLAFVPHWLILLAVALLWAALLFWRARRRRRMNLPP